MSAKDIFHDAVRKGLEKESWVITDDPLRIRSGRVDMQIDLGAEGIIAAEKGEEKIAVEIKSFVSSSNISEFHTALGQFLNYRLALKKQQPDRFLYLAVPQGVYETFFNLPFIEEVIDHFQLSLLIYDPNNEVISLWKK
ncbi:MAG: fatty-acid oxidation protein subunit alpha [Dolichospermum sp. LBC05a]|nr:XisH family protein [Dolichospermum sp. OL01]MCO5795646.1 XisH family protein [Dolichospermum sp. OL03]MCS6282122.1 XisH family protein [Dolichospermum sp.]QSV57333.1 MAG: fatty-acid oxidation protein subunit alpha [Dolichospermum sp. LBC05a]